ncbi:topoisomerase I binding, arginine/serine-rich a [Kryptolebias marmoratus]|uniref:topoisomerase I binding, arginine/serine-rich a n=1 Tax=Kryptolebias marmoratus TaxID=37003 RepID=UPI0007F8DE75|nr:topoisomerase I binding, arginine/serine-rich a [Kryptolebias marmoratus]
MSAVKIALPHSQKDGSRQASKTMSAEVSPDSKCPICLDKFNNISHLDRCLHKFCFRCILEWSKNKAECPLCKQPFHSIYHTIKSDQDFQKYEIKQHVDNSSFGYFEGVRFRYRTTLTGVQQQMRRTAPPPDNGVMFEASTNLPQQQHDRYIRRMMLRLEAKRRAAREGRMVSNVREQEMINFRRELYRRGVRVRSVRDGGRSRDTSAEFYRRNPACLHRLVPWVKRELMVLYGAHGSLVNIVQHIIMSRITRYDMEDGAIQEELRPFLQGRTEHFLHEFISFAKSPFNTEAYDQHAVYDCPAPSLNEGGSSNSSVITISENEENSAEMDLLEDSTSNLSHSVWDDETPGPSYSTTAEQSRAEPLSVLDLDSDSSSDEERQESVASPQQEGTLNQADVALSDRNDEDCVSSDNDDCVIVGFVKPTAERTPELVQLSSDSDESAFEDTKEALLLPHHIRFANCSPTPTQRSDSSQRTENVETDRHHRLESKERASSSPSCRPKKSRKPNGTETDKSQRRGHRSKDRDHQRNRRKSKSGERRHSSKSPVTSNSSVSSHSTETDYSYFHGKDFSKCDPVYKRGDRDHRYQSYSHYRREKNGNVMRFTHRQSYYFSSHRYSRSRSRSRSRDSQRPHRRRSRSRSYSSSRSPSTKRRSHPNKPGGKRKYKARHLEESSTNSAPNPNAEGDSAASTKHKKKSKEKHRKKSRERPRKSDCGGSVALAREGKEHDRGRHRHKKKKKHKKSKKHKSAEQKSKRSPTIISINSDSDSFANNDNIAHINSNDGNNIPDCPTDENSKPED